ncbi:MAG: hypothetical protein RLZZ26_282 [Candidatus Parcubacteria bacterium]|jgi:hypothetical protein
MSKRKSVAWTTLRVLENLDGGKVFLFEEKMLTVFHAAYLTVGIELNLYHEGELFDEGITIQDPHHPRILIDGLTRVIPEDARLYRISRKAQFSSSLSALWLPVSDEVRVHKSPTALLRQIREIKKLPIGDRF